MRSQDAVTVLVWQSMPTHAGIIVQEQATMFFESIGKHTKDKYTQVLKDADLRAAYNKQLDREGYKVGVFISNEVCIGTQCVKTVLELRWKLLLEEIQVLQPDS